MISKFQIKFVKSLHQKKFRSEHHQFIVEGEKNVDELLRSNLTVNFVFAFEEWITNYRSVVPKNVELIEVNEKELLQMSTQATPNKVLAVADIPANTFEFSDNKTVVALENIQDPGNLGTIIRIADWYGIDTIICSEDTVDVYNPKVVNSTMGSFTRVRVFYTDLKKFLRESKVPVYGAVLNGKSVYQTAFIRRSVLLFGNESQGISEELKQYIDQPVTIPGIGKAESLNVAISVAVICDNMIGRKNDSEVQFGIFKE